MGKTQPATPAARYHEIKTQRAAFLASWPVSLLANPLPCLLVSETLAKLDARLDALAELHRKTAPAL